MQDIRIAAVTCNATVGRIEENLARTEHWTRQAKAAGAKLVCFPELNITGYGNLAEMASLAQVIPGPGTQRLSRLAAANNIIVLAGMAEKNPDGRPFASHGVFWPDGRTGFYRKLHLAPPEQKYYSAGDTIPIFKANGITFGLQLCYDGHFPGLATVMAAKGAEVLFIPHASPRGDAPTKHQSWLRHLPARAFDNGLFVVACNQWGANGKGLFFPGNAVVIGPSGTVLKKNVGGTGEEMLVTDLKARDLDAVRSHPMRYFFPNRRPELYT